MFVLAGLLAYLLFQRLLGRGGSGESPDQADERLDRLVQDPVCGVYVDSREAVRHKVPDGELFFCSKDCEQKFLDKSSG